MKKIHALLIPFVVFVLTIGAFLFFKTKVSVKANDSTLNANNVYFTNTDKKKIEEISTYSYAIVYIAVEGMPGETYTINYKTLDGTLIAEAKDYSQIEDASVDITIPSDSYIGYSQTIFVNIKSSGRELVTAGTNNYLYLAVTSVNGNSCDSKLKIMVNGDYNYEVENYAYGKTLKAYNYNYESYNLTNGQEDVVNHGDSKILTVPVNNRYSSKDTTLIYNKLANYFVGVEGKISWDHYYTDTTLMEYNLASGNGNLVTTAAYVTNSSFSYEWLTPGEGQQDGQSSGNTEWSKASSFSTVDYTKWKDRTYIKETYENESYKAHSNDNISFYKIDNQTTANPYVNIVNYSKAVRYSIANKVESTTYNGTEMPSNELNLKDWKAYSFIADTTAPVVENMYVLNGVDNVSKTDKIKIAVRFSEPVQVLDDNIYFTLKTNSQTVKIDDKLPKFTLSTSQDYGDGTQTLIFEADASEITQEVYLSKITGLTFSSKTGIRDFSSNKYTQFKSGNETYYNGGYLESESVSLSSDSSAESLKQIDFIIDSRTPKVDNIKQTGWKTISKSKDFYINISNVGVDFTFQYKLIKKEDYESGNYELETDLISLYDKTSIIFSDDGKNGDYYFYYKLTSYFGNSVSNADSLGNYLLKYDNEAPTISNADGVINKFDVSNVNTDGSIDKSAYTFSFDINDLPYYDNKITTDNFSNVISSIDFVYSLESFHLRSDIGLLNVYNGKNKYYSLKIDGSKVSFTIKLSDILANGSSFIDGDSQFLDLYVGVYVTDVAGNMYDDSVMSTYAYERLRFDTRKSLEDNYSILNETSQELKGLGVYKTNTSVEFFIGNDVTVSNSFNATINKYSYDRDSEKKIASTTTINKIVGTDYETFENELYKVLYDTMSSKYTITFKQTGYYEVQYDVDGSMYSSTYGIYVATDTSVDGNANDETYNIVNSDLIINEVYSLGDNKFYYNNGTQILTENYNNTTRAQFFSSKTYLDSYIKYYEYQDLSSITLTSTIARQLNSGSNANYKKASGETETAKEGQVWIRYKKSDWNFSTLTTEWVYYYYKEYEQSTPQINIQDLKANLKAAINSVVLTIEASTSKVNLVTEDYLVDGIPVVYSDQINPIELQASQTKTAISLKNAYFEGDAEIYQSKIHDDDKNIDFYFYSTKTLDFGSFTRIYYKGYDSSDSYKEITISDASSRRMNEILTTGKYELVEIDENGMSSLPIWIVSKDNEGSPSIKVEFENSSGENEIDTFNFEVDGSKYNVKSFIITDLNSLDDYAYIVVYYTNNKKNYNTYYKKDIYDGISLSDGNYTIYVSDRFGNDFTFQVSVNSTEISYQLRNVDNDYITFRCDIDTTDIFKFYVKLNGSTIDTTYAKRKNYNESGYYEVYLEDVYGNKKTSTIELERRPPSISWYYNDDNVYRAISSDTSDVIISAVSKSYYEITTRAQLQFRFSEDYGYEISDGVSIKESSSTSTTIVTIEAGKSFKLRVYYNDYEDGYIEYVVSYDEEAPSIDVNVPVDEYTFDDYSKIKVNDKNITSIGYEISDSGIYSLTNGSKIYSDVLKLNLSDETTLKKLVIYLEGIEIYSVVYDISTRNVELDIIDILKQKNIDAIYGKYKIVATDILGNESTFEFTNEKPSYYKYFLDSAEQQIILDPETARSEVKYGYDNIVFKFNEIEDIVLLVDGVYIRFVVADNILYSFVYKEDSFKEEMINATSTYNEYQTSLNGVKVYYRYLDGYFYLMIQTSDEEVHKIETRTISEYSIFPLYNTFEIYGKTSELDFVVDSNKLSFSNYVAYSNTEFMIETPYDENITSIKWAYNNSNQDFNYKDFDINNNSFGETDGFYRFIITNKYGNVTEYLIVISRRLLVETEVTYKDGLVIDYTDVDNSQFYTNKSVTIIIYSKNYTLTIYKDNVLYTVEVDNTNSVFDMFTLSEIGEYTIKVLDISGNVREQEVSIKDQEFNISDDILTGFNQLALKRDELYTNQMISIDKSYFATEGIFYISLIYNGSERVIYDNISQAKITNVDLKDIIGYNNMDGEYIIKFRNEYGEICEKTVHYRGTSTLDVYRMTRSETEYSNITIASAEEGIYTNNKVKFFTEANLYEFKVDNVKVNCPYEIAFPSATSAGTYTRVVTYTDEYGFNYTFDVYLIRQQISYETSEEIKDVNGVSTITKNFNILFDSSIDATYELNSKVYTYEAQELLSKDGTYKFSLTDKAGNTLKFTIKKDTIVSFEALEDGSTRALVNGDVSNIGNITISSKDQDKITVVKAYLNGELQENVTSRFDTNGKWELLIEDACGNETYFSFYIYKTAISKFIYDTPYNYQITKVVYKDKSGNVISYIDEIVQNEYNSHVELKEDGNYSLEMRSIASNETIAFEINIDNTAPNVALVGVENNGHTNKNIKITGYQEGDIIKIYRNGSLYKTINVTTSNMASPVIDEMGTYTIEVTNTIGNTTTLTFSRSYTANTASSIFIVVILVVVASGLFIGLYSRKREKID